MDHTGAEPTTPHAAQEADREPSTQEQADAAADKADAASGHVAVIDETDVGSLDPSNPNVAAGQGNYDHTRHIGEPVDEPDPDVAAAGAELDAAAAQAGEGGDSTFDGTTAAGGAPGTDQSASGAA